MDVKKMIQKYLKDIYHNLEEIYYKPKRKKLKNKTPSILTNNCIAGVIYHDMGLQFRSPTINLWFSDSDFLKFANDIKYYLNSELTEELNTNYNYPVGRLGEGEKTIEVFFMHYHSFEEAKKKWIERAKRVDYNNIYIILEHIPKLKKNSENWKAFCNIPYKNKIIITGQTEFTDPHIVNLSIYDKDYILGKLLLRKRRFGIKRFLNDFDYISFLNQPNK